jgi:hypothetical protein
MQMCRKIELRISHGFDKFWIGGYFANIKVIFSEYFASRRLFRKIEKNCRKKKPTKIGKLIGILKGLECL